MIEKTYIVRSIEKGYYVGYRDKISNEYSENWIDAKRYKTLETAIRNRIFSGYKMSLGDYRKLIKDMENNPEYLLKVLREKKLKRVTGTDSETTVEFIKEIFGRRIEIVEKDGNNIRHGGYVSGNEIYEFLKKQDVRWLIINTFKNKLKIIAKTFGELKQKYYL